MITPLVKWQASCRPWSKRVVPRCIAAISEFQATTWQIPDPYNTTIDCWNDKEITVREFSRWLAEFPADVPVVMVMAQCYCGGFGHAVFEDFKVPDDEKTLANQVRVGFFAQQHDLTAAGCRPDIETCLLLKIRLLSYPEMEALRMQLADFRRLTGGREIEPYRS